MPPRSALVLSSLALSVGLVAPVAADPPHGREAGPPVELTDIEHDAYRVHAPDGSSQPGTAPNPALSSPPHDILRAGLAPTAGGYSATMTVAGTADADGGYYVVGRYPGDAADEWCYLFHFVAPGAARDARAWCYVGTSASFDGRVRATAIHVSTDSGRTTVRVDYSNRKLPKQLEASGAVLDRVVAHSCAHGPGCGEGESLDFARGFLTSFRLA